MTSFRPESIRSFKIAEPFFDEKRGEVKLFYRLDELEFCENFLFDGAPTIVAERQVSFRRALRALALACGVSYYKAACPKSIEVEWGGLNQRAATFFQTLYTKGLAEFAYNNQIELKERVRFPVSVESESPQSVLKLQQRFLVPIGGGKDSLVTIELLKNSQQPLASFFVGEHEQFFQLAEAISRPAVHVSRTLSPKLKEINSLGALNGHVPISAIIALVAVVAALLYDYDTIAISQERSASEANLQWQGESVNHQYSKSFEFEVLLAEYISSEITPSIKYFSALRHLSELAIARRFSRLTQYHQLFSSCNKVYKIWNESERVRRWCNDCPKCRFVFLALAPWMNIEQLVEIFGKNLLADMAAVPAFEQLLGYEANKPFECVGEREECLAAFALLADGSGDSRWREQPVVQAVAKILPPTPKRQQLIQHYLSESPEHRIPVKLKEYVCGLPS